jgi:hypothetical protein
MELSESTYRVNSELGRECYGTLYWPNNVADVNLGPGHLEYPLGEGIADDLKDDVPDGEGNAEGAFASRIGRFRAFHILKRGASTVYKLFARTNKQLAPRLIFVVDSMREKNPITPWRLFSGIKAMIFRRWYDAIGWMNVLKHEAGLDRPRRK